MQEKETKYLPMNESALKKWEVQRRLEEIDRRLYWVGYVGRGDLMERFGISPQQASADFKLYLSKANNTIRFNGSIKRYVPKEGFEPLFISPNTEDYIGWAGEAGHALVTVPIPLRRVSVEILRALSMAIHQRRSVEIRYRSLTTPEGTVRRISPHSIISTGSRYHVRAYCHHRKGFRDFVLGRIIGTGSLSEPGPGKEDDVAWNTLLIARIAPHPNLTMGQRTVIEADYEMVDGVAQIHIKQALLLYFLDQFNLDSTGSERPAAIQQIVLLNPEIIPLAKG